MTKSESFGHPGKLSFDAPSGKVAFSLKIFAMFLSTDLCGLCLTLIVADCEFTL